MRRIYNRKAYRGKQPRRVPAGTEYMRKGRFCRMSAGCGYGVSRISGEERLGKENEKGVRSRNPSVIG